jgi:amino-acid N-acetyltransferase
MTTPNDSSLGGIRVRAATSDDRNDIERLLVDSRLPTDGIEAILAARPADFVVTELRGDAGVVGVAGLEICDDSALLRSVAVRPDFQGQHLGRQLVEHAIQRAEDSGVGSLYLLTTTAAEYFPRFGFRVIDRARVPSAIAETIEFTSACPASAIAMHRALS